MASLTPVRLIAAVIRLDEIHIGGGEARLGHTQDGFVALDMEGFCLVFFDHDATFQELHLQKLRRGKREERMEVEE